MNGQNVPLRSSWPGVFTVLGLVKFSSSKSLLILFSNNSSIPPKISNVLASVTLISLISVEFIPMASFFNLNTVYLFPHPD